MTFRLVTTRPDQAPSLFYQQLTAAGIDCHNVAIMDIEMMADDRPLINEVLALDQYFGVFVTSPIAARHFAEQVDLYWPQPILEQLWICPGEGTAQVLKEFGLPAQSPAGTGSEAIVKMDAIRSASGAWLIVKGQGGRDLVQHVLRQRGCRVKELELYRRRPRDGWWHQLPADAELVLISSAEVLDEYVKHGNAAIPVLLTSQRLVQRAQKLGLDQYILSSSANPHCIITAVQDFMENQYE